MEGPKGPLAGSAAQRRTLALIAVIAASGERGISREKLIGLLWPDSTDERARHVLAQTLYRLRQELGAAAIEGSTTLRVNSESLTVDFTEFEDAVARGELERAASLYAGPFLDGFYLAGAPEFEPWAEVERSRLASLYKEALQRLATDAERQGFHARATTWLRSLSTVDPLDSRVAARLVTALGTAGDRAGALQYARVHEMLVKQQLDAEPDAEFKTAVALVQTRRSVESAPTSVARPAQRAPVVPTAAASETAELRQTFEHFRFAIRRRPFFAGLAAFGVFAASAAFVYIGRDRDRDDAIVIAVGQIVDHTGGDTTGTARTLPEMLTTNLSRLKDLHVVSRARLFELDARLVNGAPSASAFARAAEAAGADRLLDGALYRRADGTFRLDLQLADLQSGMVRPVQQVEASNVFALADSATVHLASSLGVPVPAGLRVADVTTSSPLAFRLYEEGLRVLRQGDMKTAQRLLDAAFDVDTGFAMAAFGAYHAYGRDGKRARDYLARAMRLAERATDRERLVIRVTWAHAVEDPSRVAIAETLAARYPAEPESHVLVGQARLWAGDFAGALASSRHAYAMDSLTLRASAPRCWACEALWMTVMSYTFMDSSEAAERVAREWVARQPSSTFGWSALSDKLAARDDSAGALAAYERARATGYSTPAHDLGILASVAIRTGNFAKADRLLGQAIEVGNPAPLWWLVISRRYQGRLVEALASADLLRRTSGGYDDHRRLYAQVLFEIGRYGEAASLFDSLARGWRNAHVDPPTIRARHDAWLLTHKAAALAADGQTHALDALADSLRVLGSKSGYGRDQRLHHHVRGMLLAARGRREEAVAEFRRALWSPIAGYTRTNLELGRLLLDLGRPHEAIPILRAGLRGALDGSQLYVTHTEIRAVLARAFAAAAATGAPGANADSAATHRRWVERATAAADPPFRRHVAQLLDGAVATAR